MPRADSKAYANNHRKHQRQHRESHETRQMQGEKLDSIPSAILQSSVAPHVLLIQGDQLLLQQLVARDGHGKIRTVSAFPHELPENYQLKMRQIFSFDLSMTNSR